RGRRDRTLVAAPKAACRAAGNSRMSCARKGRAGCRLRVRAGCCQSWWFPFGEALVKSQALEGRSGAPDASAAWRYVGAPEQRSGTIAETLWKAGPWKAVLVFAARRRVRRSPSLAKRRSRTNARENVQARKSSRRAHRRAMTAVKPPEVACCVAACP